MNTKTEAKPWEKEDTDFWPEIYRLLCKRGYSNPASKRILDEIVLAINSHDELLEAVKMALEIMPNYPAGGVLAKKVDNIKKVIAKAEGK